MSDAVTETEVDAHQLIPLPENTQEVLRAILDAGNTAFLDDADRMIAGTPARPGRALPCTTRDGLLIAAEMLIGGERGLFFTTRQGRFFAQHGSLAGFDDSTTDVRLADWATGGRVEYLESELLAAIEAYHYRVALTRAEALKILINLGVVSADEARTDAK